MPLVNVTPVTGVAGGGDVAIDDDAADTGGLILALIAFKR